MKKICIRVQSMRAIFPRHLEKGKWFSNVEVIKGWTEAMQLMVGSQMSVSATEVVLPTSSCTEHPKLNYQVTTISA